MVIHMRHQHHIIHMVIHQQAVVRVVEVAILIQEIKVYKEIHFGMERNTYLVVMMAVHKIHQAIAEIMVQEVVVQAQPQLVEMEVMADK